MFLLEHSGVYASSLAEAAYLLLSNLTCINCWLLYLYSCLLTRRYFSKSTVVEGIQRLLGEYEGEGRFLFSSWWVAVLDCSHMSVASRKLTAQLTRFIFFSLCHINFVYFNGSRFLSCLSAWHSRLILLHTLSRKNPWRKFLKFPTNNGLNCGTHWSNSSC